MGRPVVATRLVGKVGPLVAAVNVDGVARGMRVGVGAGWWLLKDGGVAASRAPEFGPAAAAAVGGNVLNVLNGLTGLQGTVVVGWLLLLLMVVSGM